MRKIWILGLILLSTSVVAQGLCPKDKPLEWNGECFSCNDGHTCFTKEICHRCPNRLYVEGEDAGNCLFKHSVNPDKPLFGTISGLSYDRGCEVRSFTHCNILDALKTTEENCNECPNRAMLVSQGDYYHGQKLCAWENCPQEFPMRSDNLRCEDCNKKDAVHTTKEECDKCSERVFVNGICVKKCDDKTVLDIVNGWCEPCNATYPITTSKEECDKCANKIYKDGKCELKSCPANAPMKRSAYSPWGEFEDCLSCETDSLEISSEECAKCGDIRSFENGLCLFRKSIHKDRPLVSIGSFGTDGVGFLMGEYSCDIEEPLVTTKSNCDECPERIYKNGYCYSKKFLEEDCPSDAPLKTGIGCGPCDIIEDVATPTEKDCLVCNNRKVVREKDQESFKCVLESCPSDKPLKALYWGCRRCDEDYHVFTATEEACNVCSNRKATPSGKEFNCVIKTCPADKPLKFSLYNEGCIGCDGRLKSGNMTLWRIEVDTEEECLACPNREVVKHGDSIYCDLPSTCPVDKPMRTNNTGTCIACDDPNAIDIVPETECLKCPELRVWEPDRYCRFKKSPDSARPLIGRWGNEVIFESCDTLNQDVFTTKENCDLCPNREYVNKRCILKESK